MIRDLPPVMKRIIKPDDGIFLYAKFVSCVESFDLEEFRTSGITMLTASLILHELAECFAAY
jgi:hypothetical protein